MSDGIIRIDTKINESGLKFGIRNMFNKFDGSMRDMLKSSDSTARSITRNFDDAWQNMSWDEKAKLTASTIDRIGDSFNDMGQSAQRAALKETFEQANASAEKLKDTTQKTGDAIDTKVNPPMRRMSVYGHGLTRIINAMIPGMYRMRRASVGFAEAARDMKVAAGAGGSLSAVLSAIPKIMVTIAAVSALALFALIRWAQKFTDTLYKNLSVTSAMRDKVTQLKGAFDTLKGTTQALGATLLNALAPALLKIIDWLVKAINWLSIFIAALTGQKTVMQYVSGAADSAANSTGKLAKNTRDVEKAAEGALAAFDEINVLQMEKPSEETGGSSIGGNIIMKEVPVPDDFIKSAWGKFIDWLKGLWDGFGIWLQEKFAVAGEWLGETYLKVAEWLSTAYMKVAEWADKIVQWIFETAKNIGTWINENVIIPIVDFFSNAIDKIGKFFSDGIEKIKTFFANLPAWIKQKISDPIENYFKTALNNIVTFFTNAKANVQNLWSTIVSWFTNTIIDPIKNGFSIALDWIKTKWEDIFGGIKYFVKNTINSIIDFINTMIRAITTGINAVIGGLNSLKVTIPSWVPVLGGNTWGLSIPRVSAPQIPRLATGAVIPPNSEFAAILGDQRTGRNIEAPEGLIRQIIQEEIGNIQTDVEIKFGGSLGSLVRELKPYIDKENTRIGGSLVKGSTA